MGVATGVFQYPNGSPVASGLYQWKLSSDAIQISTPSCNVPVLINGNLSSGGSMSAVFVFNDDLQTTAGASTTYQLTVKDLHGGQVWNESYYLTGTAANINLLPPAGSGGSFSFPSDVIFTSPPGDQTILNNNLTIDAGLTVRGAFEVIGNVSYYGFINRYLGVSLVNSGFAYESAQASLATYNGITSGNLFSNFTGFLRLNWFAQIATPAGISSRLGGLTFTYSDVNGNIATVAAAAQLINGSISTFSTDNASSTALLGMPLIIVTNQSVGNPVTYTMDYASVPSHSMTYNLLIIAETF